MSGSVQVGKRANFILPDRDIVGENGEHGLRVSWFGMLKVKSCSCIFVFVLHFQCFTAPLVVTTMKV